MAAKRAGAARGTRNVFAATFAKFRTGGRSDEARRRFGKMPLLARFAAHGPEKGPDPVSLAVFAIDHVGAAAVRACASGVEVRIAAADEATAAVIRAAWAKPSDRRISVLLDQERSRPSGRCARDRRRRPR